MNYFQNAVSLKIYKWEFIKKVVNHWGFALLFIIPMQIVLKQWNNYLAPKLITELFVSTTILDFLKVNLLI